MRTVGRILLAAAALMAVAQPALAGVSMTVTPSSTVSWTLASTGANTTSGGTLTVSANEPYTVTVSGDKSRLSEWNTSASSYVSDGKTLGAAMDVIAARTGGSALIPGVGATATIGASSTLATGTGGTITDATDQYSITLSQLTAITDSALPAGRTYHIVLTYTASPTL